MSYFDCPLETPYAFSHHQAAFYWTREEACEGHMWNIFARPPCVNCIVAGHTTAMTCDRMYRQLTSRGKIAWCTRCEHAGMGIACVETLEISILPKFQDVLRDGPTMSRTKVTGKGTDLSLWTTEAKALRSQGKVIWRPINLRVGDAKWKAEVVEEFLAGRQTGEITWACMNPMLSHEQKISEDGRMHQRIKVMMKRKLEMWDLHDQGVFEDQVWSPPPSRPTSRPPASRPLSLQVNAPHQTEENVRVDQKDGSKDIQSITAAKDVAQEVRKLQSQVLRAKASRYQHDFDSPSQANAEMSKTIWHHESETVLAGIKEFIELKASYLNRGEDEEFACWESMRRMDAEVIEEISSLVPTLLHPGCNSSDAV